MKGIQTMMSAKLAEGKLVVYDQEDLSEFNPKLLKESFIHKGENLKCLFIHPKNPEKKFFNSIQLVKNYKPVNPNQVNVRDLLQHDKVIFTKKSLKEFSELFLAYLFYLNKPKAVNNEKVNEILHFNVV